MNYYELLEVTPGASAEVIRNAYKTLAKKFHPDTYGGDRTFAEEKMKLLNEAISVLGNEEKRKLYNEENNIGSYTSLTTFSSPDLSEVFMGDIDTFITKNSAKNKNTKKPKSRKQKLFSDDDDDDDDGDFENIRNTGTHKNINADVPPVEDIENITKYKYAEESIRKLYEDEEIFDADTIPQKSRKRGKHKIGKWYYIAVCALIALNILLVFLITRTVNLDNLRSMISSKSGQANAVGAIDIDGAETDLGGDESDFEPQVQAQTEPVIETEMAANYESSPEAGIPVPKTGEGETTLEYIGLPVLPTQATTASKQTAPAPTQKPTAAPKTEAPTAKSSPPPATEPAPTTAEPVENIVTEAPTIPAEPDTDNPDEPIELNEPTVPDNQPNPDEPVTPDEPIVPDEPIDSPDLPDSTESQNPEQDIQDPPQDIIEQDVIPPNPNEEAADVDEDYIQEQ